MTAPVVESASSAGVATSGSTLTIGKPTGLSVGDLMVAGVSLGFTNDGFTWSLSGWTRLSRTNGYTSTDVLWKIADSSDVAASDFTFTASTTYDSRAGGILRISGAHATTPIAAVVDVENSSGSANPDPANVSTGTAADYLCLTVMGLDNDRLVTPSANYTEWVDVLDGGGMSSCCHIQARALTAATSEDPGTLAITDASSRGYLVFTLLVAPVSAAIQTILPDADIATTGWTTTPLWPKIDDDPDAPDGTVISATLS